MAQTISYLPRLHRHAGPVRFPLVTRPSDDPASAARGVLYALALSCIAWVALALAVPLLW
jgi:hypothetical protein